MVVAIDQVAQKDFEFMGCIFSRRCVTVYDVEDV